MGLSTRAALRRKRTLSHGASPWQPGLGWVTLATWSCPVHLTRGQWSQSHKACGICGQAGAGPPSKACPQGASLPSFGIYVHIAIFLIVWGGFCRSFFFSLNFCLSEKLLLSPLILNEILAGYSNLGCRFFPFSTLNISCHSLLACSFC